MASTRQPGRRPGKRLAMAALFGAAFLLTAPGVTRARDSPIKLALLPIGQAGSFFDLIMAPGEARSFAVEIANDGTAALEARTYASDVYTIINGGFGARLRDDRPSGMTTWLDYPTEVRELQVGQAIDRTFALSVPADAAPGEYITSLVLENDQPLQGVGAVAVNQIIRQAVAVVVTVPGPRSPGLAIGAASQAVVAGQSVVSVAVANTGNVRLKPLVTFALLDAAGVQIDSASVQMDTFYAHTSTYVEVTLATILSPGAYTVHLTLDDATQDARADGGTIALVVQAPTATAPNAGGAAGVTAGNQAGGDGQTVPFSVVVLFAGVLLGSGVAGLLGLGLWRRRRRVAP